MGLYPFIFSIILVVTRGLAGLVQRLFNVSIIFVGKTGFDVWYRVKSGNFGHQVN